MAQVAYYNNKLRDLMDNPDSFKGTPGFAFARDQALGAVGRQNSAIRGGGAAMTELADRAGSMAGQNYLSYLHELGGLSGQEQQYDLGEGQNANTATKIKNDFDLGGRTLDLDRYKTDQTLGFNRYKQDQDNALGMTKIGADFTLGREQNANGAQRDLWGYDIARRKDSLDRSTAENSYNLDADKNALGWYGAQTQRGNGRSASDLAWGNYNRVANPVRRFV